MASYLVTGTSRGIGLEIVRQLESYPSSSVSKIFAVTRSAPSPDLAAIIAASKGRAFSIVASISDPGSLKSAAQEVQQELNGAGLDVLINNAGAGPLTPDGLQSISKEFMMEMLEVNVLTAHLVTAAFLPLLRQGREKRVINISSTLGSMSLARFIPYPPIPAYKVAKAALNMLTVQYAMELEKDGFTFLALAPGWLRTNPQNADADLDVETGVRAIMEQVMGAGASENGKFRNIRVEGWDGRYDGGDIAW